MKKFLIAASTFAITSTALAQQQGPSPEALTNISLTFLFIYLVVYFLPTLLARHDRGVIFLINLFLGWTIIGWAFALIWGLIKPRAPVIVYVQGQGAQIVEQKPQRRRGLNDILLPDESPRRPWRWGLGPISSTPSSRQTPKADK